MTRMATLDSASLCRRAAITRLWTLSPSRPASGLSLTLTVMEMVGGSMGWAGRASSTSMAHRVSATVAFDRPAMATMSPASASSIGWRFRPRKASTLVMRPRSISLPSMPRAWIARPGVALPLSMRPVSRRPRKGSFSISTESIWKGSSLRCSALGGGTCSTMRSNRGARLSLGLARSMVAQPFLPLA